jgi:sigma-B regulation protein RsbU (phosphoserine phosphatase)
MRKNGIGVKMYSFVSAIALIIAAGLIFISYSVHGQRIDTMYKEMTVESAKTSASFVNGDNVERFTELFKSEEYQALRAEAEKTGDMEPIKNWMMEKGMYDDYTELWDYLQTFRDKMGLLYLYIVAVEGKTSVIVSDPSEEYSYQGMIVDNESDFGEENGNNAIAPTITNGEFGWLCSAYEPVYDSTGKAVAVVGVDIDMNDVMTERHHFLFNMLLYGVLVTIAAIAMNVWLTRKIVVRPVEALTGEMKKFTATDEGYEQAHVAKLEINSKDEIEELYHGIRDMQISTVDYLQNLARVTAENERVTAEKERISTELNVATQIQADMLPRIFPAFPERSEFDIYATMTPAKEVGGDFYDFFLVDDNHLGLVMADVSGKGVPAALFMVIAKTLIKNRSQMGGTPAQILSYANDQLCEGNEAELFVTVWLAIIEISTGKGIAANAGHEHPAIRRGNGTWELSKYRHSPAVATMEGLRFREHEFELHSGDSLYVYTDGVTEATNADNVLFGEERLVNALNREPMAVPEVLLKNVKEDIDLFVADAPQFDDITMLGITWN